MLQQVGRYLRTRVKVEMCEQICDAMCALLQACILHRDLAARNVLVQSVDPVHVKVCTCTVAQERGNTAGWGPLPAACMFLFVPKDMHLQGPFVACAGQGMLAKLMVSRMHGG